ncbi:MAG: ParB/RepB/Spo0J family partition protein [Dichotomicrobium sp.]
MSEETSTAQRNRLGRGLASLVGDNPSAKARSGPPEGDQIQLPIDRIKPGPLNPRQSFSASELEELANSIREKGLVQPLVVRPMADETHYEIVAGERRWRAAQMAGLHRLPVVIRSLTDQEALELAIIENVQRTDLNAIEEAAGYHELIGRFGYTQDELSQIIGKSRSHLSNMLRLLKLPDGVQKLVRSGDLSPGHARALIGREDADHVAKQIVEKGLSVRDVEALSQEQRSGGSSSGSQSKSKDPDTRAFEQEIADALGLTVALKPGSGESGELRIRYRTLEQLEGVRTRLLGDQA